ncbi:MAG TPA: flagellar biosynthetic protein FliR [Chitinispirillaceae bacterium]|nr:flagellar biosynthetic protein FliR [Chitinispirillaceae bacterium]
MELIPFNVDQVIYFFLIFVRISTIIALLPVFGSWSIPFQLKIGLSLLLAVILFNPVMVTVTDNKIAFSPGLFVLLVIKEVIAGLAIGFVSSLLFTAVQFAGMLIDNEMGFGFVELADPFTDEPITVLGQFQVVIFTILFLLFNGHYFLILAIQKSFELVPLMNVTFSGDKMLVHIITMISNIFVLALKFSAPVYVTLFLTELALGVIARTVPQINIFFVGMPLKIVIGLGSTIIVLPMLSVLFQKTVEGLIQDIWRLLYLMA